MKSRDGSSAGFVAPDSWTMVQLVFLRKPDWSAEKSIRGHRAAVVVSVMAKWWSSAVLMLNVTKKTKGRGRLHVRAERGVTRQPFRLLMTGLWQKPWERQENRKEVAVQGAHRYKTMYLASLYVKTSFDVAKRGIVAEILREAGGAWVDRCSCAGGDGEPQGRGQCGIMRDGMLTFKMHQAGKRGGTQSMDETGEVHFVEGRVGRAHGPRR